MHAPLGALGQMLSHAPLILEVDSVPLSAEIIWGSLRGSAARSRTFPTQRPLRLNPDSVTHSRDAFGIYASDVMLANFRCTISPA